MIWKLEAKVSGLVQNRVVVHSDKMANSAGKAACKRGPLRSLAYMEREKLFSDPDSITFKMSQAESKQKVNCIRKHDRSQKFQLFLPFSYIFRNIPHCILPPLFAGLVCRASPSEFDSAQLGHLSLTSVLCRRSRAGKQPP